ncbi:hypothetical protein BJ546DRAFT_491800 [Cryomyces antarcticus]|uniref:Steroid 5-alpha reductase C-terminal domain-containing protein n=1 Tax=Cryomyces antarcticus TaxID=329879 RepID=A0ABR0KRJ8_9PEZI|nr:hypothetical protein LTR39_004233 [Cryomyces antarcticus]KAK5012387.1 hypothetical protein LTR60_004408 [Cryomyces antarcticus]KAK5119274.1 hypothetical protein LTR16_004839 [Cryomyces antarcticus]KAK5169995.1 hypothetical protein LTR04_005284 [Oleoguttula sp. CCFEE 6159]
MTLLTTLLHATSFRSPFLRTLLPSIGLAYALQAAVAAPSIAAQTERFYDLSGSLTYLSCTALSLYLPTIRARAAASLSATKPGWPSLLGSLSGNGGSTGWNWRQVVLSAAVSIWATRLGTYLFGRISADGSDSRFDAIRSQPAKFFGAFMAQATWVSLCLLPVLALNSIPAATLAALPALTVTDVLGLSLFVGGLGFEVVADRQKSAWVAAKKAKRHNEEFLTSGLWSKSRHPNYFGEATLWSGVAVLAGGVLASGVGQVGMGWKGGVGGRAGAVAMAAVSPAFVTFLLLKVSGVPLSENKYDKRYGDRKDYQAWKRDTPMFIPKF